ncbi:MAG: 16S rRNA (cytosine(1402)-N(4))-methyltransferase RsmH, partial [Oscillospiraceae bacterium]
LSETVDGLNIKKGGIYVDGTCGGAGHSSVIAKKLGGSGMLIAIDKDPDAIKIIKERLKEYPNVKVVMGDFREIPYILDTLGIEKVDGIMLDLGVSSHQLDTGERGFSYNFDAPLDMRMSQDGKSAYDVVNTYSVSDLTRIMRDYGEEKFANRIANNIVKARETNPIETTFELVDIIKNSMPAAAKRESGHPAKRTFQAIRIEVNDELGGLKTCLEESFERLNVGGRFSIITFHSLEDKIVKHIYTLFSKGCTCPPDFPVCVCGKKPRAAVVNKKPILPSKEELECNKRSHSAKLRILEKL